MLFEREHVPSSGEPSLYARSPLTQGKYKKLSVQLTKSTHGYTFMSTFILFIFFTNKHYKTFLKFRYIS